MQCPRCGLQNPPGISACQRCGLAVVQTPPAGAPSSEPAAGSTEDTSVLSTTPDPGQTDPGQRAAAGQTDPQTSAGQPGSPPPDYGQPGPPQPGYAPPGYPQPGYGEAGYGQAGYGQPGYGQAGYGQGGYASPPTQPYPQYAQPSAPGSYPSYGAPTGSPYSTGATAPYGGTATWPTDITGTDTTGGGAGLSRVLLLLAAAASVVYAVWAMTARRGIFADFADNKTVSLNHAQSSDRTDTILLVIAGGLAVLALALWLIRLLGGKSRGGVLTLLGFLVSLAGMVCVVVGLVMSGMVDDGATRVDEGQRAVTSTVVTGSGFIALAAGLLIGLLVVKARGESSDSPAPGGTTTTATSTAGPW